MFPAQWAESLCFSECHLCGPLNFIVSTWLWLINAMFCSFCSSASKSMRAMEHHLVSLFLFIISPFLTQTFDYSTREMMIMVLLPSVSSNKEKMERVPGTLARGIWNFSCWFELLQAFHFLLTYLSIANLLHSFVCFILFVVTVNLTSQQTSRIMELPFAHSKQEVWSWVTNCRWKCMPYIFTD